MATIARPDILIQSPQWYPLAVVELQNLPNLTRDLARELRQNLIEYGVPSRVPYFLLLSEDVGFLWTEAQQMDPAAAPAYEFPMDRIVMRYLGENSERRLYHSIFGLIVFQWLNDLAMRPGNTSEEPEKTLALSGFSEAIRDAKILTEDQL